eukprot:TRINITY_DN62055_c0_g1_i1.p1 TRINITY_DN62055_c0_g1~~TRINITY_DN62055_c0_g1_i1.p1  ORF type:complete len:414 (+),score=48.85 TRINITY_DN62055_c0_g1_i1:193-1434(+)
MGMAAQMVSQFTDFLSEAGYDGPVTWESMDVPQLGSLDEALMECAMYGAFGSMCCLFANRRSRRPWGPALWRRSTGEETSAFPGSVNFDLPNPREDGQEFMLYTSVMQLGVNRRTSILESGPLRPNVLLLFAERLALDSEAQLVRFDKWSAETEVSKATEEQWELLVALRERFTRHFADALSVRDLSSFPVDLVRSIGEFVLGPQLPLRGSRPGGHPPEEKDCIGGCYQWMRDDGEAGDTVGSGVGVVAQVNGVTASGSAANCVAVQRFPKQALFADGPRSDLNLADRMPTLVPPIPSTGDQGQPQEDDQVSDELISWLAHLDPDGFLCTYASTFRARGLFRPSEVALAYATKSDGLSARRLDERFFIDLGVQKLGHRRMFERWFLEWRHIEHLGSVADTFAPRLTCGQVSYY